MVGSAIVAGNGVVLIEIPDGGAPGEVLTKITADDFDFDWVAPGGGGSTIIVEDEGVPVGVPADTLDFVGAGVIAAGAGTTKTITIAGIPIPASTLLDATLRADGAGGWVEETQIQILASGRLQTLVATGPAILDEASGNTNPTIIPNKNNLATGLGTDASDTLALIADGEYVIEIADDSMVVRGGKFAIFTGLLDMQSTVNPFLPPRLTTIQKNALANTEGSVVYDTDLDSLYQNDGAVWTVPGAGLTDLQTAYDNDPTAPQILINSTPDPFWVRASVAGPVIAVQNIAGTDVFSVANTGTMVVDVDPNNSMIKASGVASAGGNYFGFDFDWTMSANFSSTRGFIDRSQITSESFSYSVFEIAPSFLTATGTGGVFSFITGMIFNPTINSVGTLRNLTGYFYFPTLTAGTILNSYGIYIDHNGATATNQVGGFFAGDDGALQVGTGALSAPTVNGVWFQDGSMVLGGSTQSNSERLRVRLGTSLFEGIMAYESLSPTALGAGNNNNYNGFATGSSTSTARRHWNRISGNATTSVITGIDAGGVQNGYCLKLTNVSANAIDIGHQDTNSTAANRIISPTGATYQLGADESCEIIYDSTASRWRILYGSGA